MKRIWIPIFCMLLGGVAGPALAQNGKALNVGGGIHFDENSPGINVALDLPLAGDIVVSPFVDFFFKSDSKVYGTGINLLLKRPAGGRGWVYIGGGGGLGYYKSVRDYVPTGGTVAEKISASKTQVMGNAVFGMDFSASEKAMLFVQFKWMPMLGSEQTLTLSDGTNATVKLEAKQSYAIQLGVSYQFGEGDRY